MSGVSFKNGAKTFLDSDLADTDTTARINAGDWPKFNRVFDFYCLLLGADRHEIIKVTGASVPHLTILRGQEGTSADDWPRGTLVYQALTAVTLSSMIQTEAFRQGAYNPNGALASLYFGEKFYQSDDELWWKSVAAASTEWRLIAGEIVAIAPTYSPIAGSYTNGQLITIGSLTPSADIYYTIDETDPDDTDTLYSTSITLPDDTTTELKSIAYGPDRWYTPSSITSGSFTMSDIVGNTLTLVAATTTAYEAVHALAVHDSKLYGTARGRLLEYTTAGGAWSQVAPLFSGETVLRGLLSFNGKLYGCGNQLLEWNDADAWVSVSNSPGGLCYGAMAEFNSNLYVIMSDGELFEWNGTDTLVSKSSAITGVSVVYPSIIEDGGEIYTVPFGSSGGGLYKWNGVDDWTNVHGNTGIGGGSTYASFYMGGEIYAMNDAGGVYQSNGSAWVTQGTVQYQNFSVKVAVRGGNAFVVSDYTSRMGRFYEPNTGENLTPTYTYTKNSIAVFEGEIHCGNEYGELERLDYV